jgi:hypothetical protein
MNQSAPQFVTKGQTVPMFLTKNELDSCTTFRATITWTAALDLDLIAGVMRQSTLLSQPISMIYQAGNDNASTRSLKFGADLIATLFDDDTNGSNDNTDKSMLEACVVKNQAMIDHNFDSIVFGLIGYNGDRLRSMDATITISALNDQKEVITSKIIRVDNFEGNVAGIATAYFSNGQWYLSTNSEDFGFGIKGPGKDDQHEGLIKFWNCSQQFSAKAVTSVINN